MLTYKGNQYNKSSPQRKSLLNFALNTDFHQNVAQLHFENQINKIHLTNRFIEIAKVIRNV